MQKFNLTENDLVKIAQRVQPSCAFDPQSLCQLANQIENLAEQFDEMKSMINHVHKRVCVSNGEQSLIDAQREEKQWRTEHVKEHEKLFGVGKYVVGLIVTLILAILPALYGLFAASIKTEQLDKKLNMLEQQIINSKK